MRDPCGASVGARDSLHWRGGVGAGERNSVKGDKQGSSFVLPKSVGLLFKYLVHPSLV